MNIAKGILTSEGFTVHNQNLLEKYPNRYAALGVHTHPILKISKDNTYFTTNFVKGYFYSQGNVITDLAGWTSKGPCPPHLNIGGVIYLPVFNDEGNFDINKNTLISYACLYYTKEGINSAVTSIIPRVGEKCKDDEIEVQDMNFKTTFNIHNFLEENKDNLILPISRICFKFISFADF